MKYVKIYSPLPHVTRYGIYERALILDGDFSSSFRFLSVSFGNFTFFEF